MRQKFLVATMTILFAFTCVGCSTEAPRELEAETLVSAETPEQVELAENVETAQVEETSVEETATTESQEETMADPDGQESVEVPEFTFADLSTKEFQFSTGAGGWSEELRIEKDGYFTGKLQDYLFIDNGGSDKLRINSYSGHFTNLTKIDDYTYRITLADISYKGTSGSEVEVRGVPYVYADSNFLVDTTNTFAIYLPGKPLNEIPEAIFRWMDYLNESDSELTTLAIVNETYQNAMYSYDRPAPLEDAQEAYRVCREACEEYADLLSNTYTTQEMVEYSGAIYEESDECLNYIWNLIRYNVDEDKYQEILAEQREWIAEKEAAAADLETGFGGGSYSAVDYNDVLGQKTLKRCEELIEYLK